ncbi:hypothetical protein CS543_08500 [Porphyromonas gingivalis]|uniref:hypothetical protein n=1 Tax=Porphyromonas gingivalis TaxID=837 RepID=UPI000975082A|nr:hypothetical protein [Porphyromonas gingivalis]ATS10860.1 hypothetical protein CS543_08500 [Porphyromonas gingivalis]RZQ67760.1 hypothetical protein EW639_04365 [Porphyromonas gingivalis]SJL26427.1 hypothetical protein PGIN_84-3_00295 [Porphyromonas gingivalis]
MNRRKQQGRRQPPGERRPSRKRMVWGAIVVLLNCVLLFRLCSADKEPDSGAKAAKEQYWLNYDPNRPVTDILNYDYDNRMIIYRDTGRFSDTPSPTPDEGEKKADQDDEREPLNDYEDYYEELYDYFHD